VRVKHVKVSAVKNKYYIKNTAAAGVGFTTVGVWSVCVYMSVHYTTSCKHSLALLMMDEIIARNMLSGLKLLTKLSLLHLVGCLYYYINDARSHRHESRN